MSDKSSENGEVPQNNEQKEEVSNNHNVTSTIQPTNAQKKDLGILQSHTNNTIEAKQIENNKQEGQEKYEEENIDNDEFVQPETAKKEQPVEEEEKVSSEKKVQPVQTSEVSIQAGDGKQQQVVKCYDQTYAPESCRTHEIESKIVSETLATEARSQRSEALPGNEGGEIKKQQVQIQVGISLIDEPQKVLSQAKQERILQDFPNFSKFLQNQKTQSQNQKLVYSNIFEEIQKKKMQQYAWYYTLKEYFTQYSGFTKEFYEKCQKLTKQQKVQQLNKYLNIGQELKQGFQQLGQFKRETGDKYKKINEFITAKITKDLAEAYNKYINQMNSAQALVNEKKKQSIKVQEQFKKQGWKIQKMYTRVKEGKKEEQDFFVQMSTLISLYNKYKEALIQWGKQIIELRKSLIDLTESCTVDIQFILNSFKTESNTLYGIQKAKYDKIIKSRDEIVADTLFSKLITLTDADYIRSTLEAINKKEVLAISEEQFEDFIELKHFQQVIGEPNQLLTNLIVKIFNLKDQNQELVNTVSGNLVLFNKNTSSSVQKISIKNIKAASPVQQGVIELQEKVPGVIFNSKRTTKLQFKDGDRAEELICFLGQGDTNN